MIFFEGKCTNLSCFYKYYTATVCLKLHQHGFSAMFCKGKQCFGDNLSDHLLSPQSNQVLAKRGLTLIGKNLLPEKQILSFKS